MDIITRADAKLKGLKTYFTGQECKSGHLTYRYTQSGTCAMCIRSANNPNSDPTKEERRAAAAQLVQVKLRIFSADLETLKASAFAFAAMRFPVLQMSDVYPGLLPSNMEAGTGLYRFNCHVDDVAALRDLAGQLIARGSVNGAQVREEAARRIAQAQGAPLPEWAERP